MVILNNFGFIYLLRHIMYFFLCSIYFFFFFIRIFHFFYYYFNGMSFGDTFFSFINKFFFTLVINSMCDGRTIR
uniref:Uncharacterized protein n=1 Tax=Rhizophagus irregularis (strain DAOM 181602 / DAOM 197198 / MUCL 43194) TaxID=747089 RepID=U9U0N8_RHIID